ncbi:hypothetical protein HU200_060781 [Digitaria exilis]|uniref:F-box protein AT5G49610-like beta-propeller domain-containing protein n=1 Tax=Digitaria exilis TaxID=1010633 RepID=A0A835E1Z4_9POAL|nr:hypothetical protein HU200_060781 [Digitaria exilis]
MNYAVQSPLRSPSSTEARVRQPPSDSTTPRLRFSVRCAEQELIQQVVYVRRQGNSNEQGSRDWAVHISRPLQLPVLPVFIGEPYSLRHRLHHLLRSGHGNLLRRELPDAATGVSSGAGVRVVDHGLARAGDSGINFVHVKGEELHVWFRRMDDGGNLGIWERVKTVHLPVAFGDLDAMPLFWDNVRWLSDCMNEFDRAFHSAEILAVGDNAEFVFLTLRRGGGIFLLDVNKVTVEKVLQMPPQPVQLYGICPFMMPWPPVFPALKQRG